MAQLENVYIRGSKIRFLILPDMLKNAPMFKRQGQKAANTGSASGRGKSAILRAQGNMNTVLFAVMVLATLSVCLIMKYTRKNYHSCLKI